MTSTQGGAEEGMGTEPRGRRKVVATFEVDDAWGPSLPFERAPKGITHLPLECVVDVPSTRGGNTVEPEEFARRRNDTAGQEGLGFEFEGDLWYLGGGS